MGKTDYDFSGWATRNDIRCADGLTIRRDAFKDCDGITVPIVWSHIHDDPEMVLGHALLKNEPEGVRMWGKLNDTPKGRQTKALIESGDVVGLSIWANQLKKHAGDVLHGMIREVSVVLAGANPGAFIDTVILAHSSDYAIDDNNFEAVITTGEPIELMHENLKKDDDEEAEDEKVDNTEDVDDEDSDKDVDEEETDEQDDAPDEKKQKNELKHSDTKEEGDKEMADEKKSEKKEQTVEDVFNTLTEDQKTVVYALIGQALEDAGKGDDEEDDEDSEEGEKEMKHNVFENAGHEDAGYISHDDMKVILADAKRLGSLREAVEHNMEEGGILEHAVYNHNADGTQGTEQTYGVADINYLFPDARAINNVPEFIKRNDEWVNVVINGTHHTPFSRIKSVFANITNEEARARGYVKGNEKQDEVFSLLKRSTDPQTIYKKQKLDRDDIIDITDFDVVAWMRGEMRIMLNEEIARAILIGDGRLSSDDDKIHEDHVRPIASDVALYNIKADVTVGGTMEITAKNIIRAAIRARKDYKGSGSPTLFTSETMLTEMMLLEDGLGHPLYADEAALARRMRVSRIVTCPLFDTAKVDGKDLFGVIVNLSDYNVGADKGGEINMFDDFDIDFNQQKYLIETRISGALIRPYSAITLVAAANTDGGNGEG